MLKNFSLGKKLLLGFGAVLTVMVIVSVISYTSIKSIIHSAHWVEHTHEVIKAGDNVSAAMIDMETGLRGFLITADMSYLEPYNSGNKNFATYIDEGPKLTSDNPAQVNRWNAIKELKEQWISKWAEPEIQKRKEIAKGTNSLTSFKEISARTLGKELFDGIRVKLNELDNKIPVFNIKEKHLITLTTLDLVNMETGQRGFLLSGKEASLEPYTQGKQNLLEHLKILKNTMPNLANDIKEIENAVNNWQEQVAEIEIDARRDMNQYKVTLDNLIADMAKGTGKSYMDTIRGKINEIIEAEEKLIVQRIKDQEDIAQFAQNFSIIGTILAVLLGLIIAFVSTKSIVGSLNKFQTGLLGFFRYLNKESDKTELLDDSARDEIGFMAKVVNDNITKTKTVIEQNNLLVSEADQIINKVKHGQYNNTINQSTVDGSLDELKNGVNDMISSTKEYFSQMNGILQEYTHYDYRKDIDLKKIEKDGYFEQLV